MCLWWGGLRGHRGLILGSYSNWLGCYVCVFGDLFYRIGSSEGEAGKSGIRGAGVCYSLEARFLLLQETSIFALKASSGWHEAHPQRGGDLLQVQRLQMFPLLQNAFGATPHWCLVKGLGGRVWIDGHRRRNCHGGEWPQGWSSLKAWGLLVLRRWQGGHQPHPSCRGGQSTSAILLPLPGLSSPAASRGPSLCFCAGDLKSPRDLAEDITG